MTTRRGRYAVLALFVLAVFPGHLVGAARAHQEPPEQAISTVRLPITIDVGQALQEAEAAIPTTIDRAGDWEPTGLGGGSLAKFRLSRQPLDVRIEGNRITTILNAEYGLQLGQRVGGTVTPVASCGFGSEPPRQVRAVIDTVIDVNENWELVPQSTIQSIEYPNRCQVTALNLDVTQLIDRSLRPELEQAVQNLDQQLRQFDLRSRAQSLWQQLTTPVKVRDGVWLVVEPRGIGLGPIAGSGNQLSTTLALDADTRLVFEEPAAPSPGPLPPLQRVGPGEGFQIVLDAAVPFDQITERLRAELVGKPFQVGGQQVVVSDIDASASGDRIQIRTQFTSPVDVQVTVVGQLVYDEATQTLSAENLEFTAESRDALTEALARDLLRSPAFGELIARNAKLPIGETIGAARAAATQALNRQLTEQLTLSGEVTDLEPVLLGADPEANAYRVRVRATGNARLAAG